MSYCLLLCKKIVARLPGIITVTMPTLDGGLRALACGADNAKWLDIFVE